MTVTKENPFKMQQRRVNGRRALDRANATVGSKIKIFYQCHGTVGDIAGDVTGTVVRRDTDWVTVIDKDGVASGFHTVQIRDAEVAV